MKTALSESQAEAEEYTDHKAGFRDMQLVGSSASASDNLIGQQFANKKKSLNFSGPWRRVRPAKI